MGSPATYGIPFYQKAAKMKQKYWEIIVDNPSKAGWSWGCVSAIDREGYDLGIQGSHIQAGEHGFHI
jgi:hypothetical protein